MWFYATSMLVLKKWLFKEGLVNSSGEVIFNETIFGAKTLVDVSCLTTGFYYVLIKNKEVKKIAKFRKV